MKKRILIAGITGFIGRYLAENLYKAGNTITGLTRKKPQSYQPWNMITWHDLPRFDESVDVVINLVGANIAGHLWTKRYKKILYDSRVLSTKKLSWFIRRQTKPVSLIQASAAGYYGHRPGELINESSKPGEGFLAHLAYQWEMAADINVPHRVCFLRTGIVLGQNGGILKRLKILSRFGPIVIPGSGHNYLPWIHLQDVGKIIEYIINNPDISGPLNIVAPHAVTTADFYRQLARKTKKFTVHIPDFIFKKLPHDMGKELFLSNQHLAPEKLLEKKYIFRFPILSDALDDIFK